MHCKHRLCLGSLSTEHTAETIVGQRWFPFYTCNLFLCLLKEKPVCFCDSLGRGEQSDLRPAPPSPSQSPGRWFTEGSGSGERGKCPCARASAALFSASTSWGQGRGKVKHHCLASQGGRGTFVFQKNQPFGEGRKPKPKWAGEILTGFHVSHRAELGPTQNPTRNFAVPTRGGG